MQRINAWHNCLFLSTPSGWRATVLICVGCPETLDFYPRPPGGGRLSTSTPIWRSLYFYPRPPGGGRLAGGEFPNLPAGISIHALRVEGDEFIEYNVINVTISIHALRVEGDTPPPLHLEGGAISIHALRVEGDKTCGELPSCTGSFLSTPSGWRATFLSGGSKVSISYFYPRTPGGGRQLEDLFFGLWE